MPYIEHTLPSERDFTDIPGTDGIDQQDFSYEDFSQNIRIDEATEANSIQLEKRGTSSQVSTWKKVESDTQFQGNFWTSQTVFKNSIAAKLRTIGEKQRANDLELCHSEITYARCTGCRTVQKFLNRCDKFYCPECQPRLARERKESVEWWTKEISQPKHVVLTVQNTATLTKTDVQNLKKFFSKLRRRVFCKNWTGGFYSIEVTNEGRGWHLHLHILVNARYIDSAQLAIEWNKANGGIGHIVKVKDCREKSYLQEVTKYAVKGSQLSKWKAEEIQEFISAFEGVKTFGVFGELYGKRTEFREWIKSLKEQKAKCKCGCNDIRFYNQNEWEALELQISPQLEPPPKKTDNLTLEFAFAKAIGSTDFFK